ncbi:hypothetical protein Tco_0127125 [Tanacetum coccineum]
MNIRDELVASKGKSKVDSSSTQVDDDDYVMHDELKPMTKSFTDSLSELGNLKVLENLPQVYNGSALTLDESLSRNKKKIIVCKLKLNLKAEKDQASKRKVNPKPNPKTPVKPKLKFDVGLCIESERHVSLLRRMRFKIATNILLQGSIGSLSDGEWCSFGKTNGL